MWAILSRLVSRGCSQLHLNWGFSERQVHVAMHVLQLAGGDYSQSQEDTALSGYSHV
jgi:hypothetical protein